VLYFSKLLGNNWEEFVENSQNYQSRLLKFAIEKYRQNKYKKLGGMFQFMFMDCWPSITWSVVGYDRKPKKGYHTLKQCYQPVLIGVNLGREDFIAGADRGGHPRPIIINPWVVNDRHHPLENCTYSVRITNGLTNFEVIQDNTFAIPMDDVLEQAPGINITAELQPGEYELELTLRENGKEISRNSYDIRIAVIP
jgi:beta-mannosidase